MNATPEDQRLLLEVADLDARIRRAEDARANPPQGARVKELLSQRQVQSQELSVRSGARDDLRAELSRIESDVAVVDARRVRDTERLAVSTNPKEAAGLEHELESLARRKNELEDGEILVMERLEAAEAAVSEQEALIATTNAEGAELSAAAKAHVAAAEADRVAAVRDREAVAGTVAADLLALYDRLSARGPGAGALVRRTCGGCHMVLSGTDLQKLRGVDSNEVAHCPECGCILVRGEDSGL
ncbi:zinc ribbon domain-containing protein [Microbacterium sp. C7(2022)]|uniref:zinc ribbon domain-containing protein n=1 Tax=Microbacterium sp. C7(2022) TaxID=2992759 RepID=UPI00237A62FA|nr:C4-type zinc ribbon domain-containing protein [Microbacterium sp. C7(2022)]MDE0547047.1 C4-type zinc ribbon domain-containing protein [Microbacterium sp. C7(2022)]